MEELIVSRLGLNREEPQGFTIDRPFGVGEYLFLRFHSPMQVLTATGPTCAEPGSCIVYTPDQPQWYRDRGAAWSNDWMHFRGDEVSTIAMQSALPLDTVLTPADSRFVTPIFEEIRLERKQKELHWQSIVDHLLRQFLLKLARAVQYPHADYTAGEVSHHAGFRRLRADVHERLTHHWSLEEMAAAVHLSPSRFSALYLRFFGVSPCEDLLRTRIDHARIMLTNQRTSVTEAAAQSGFESIHYFSRIFRIRVGCAPRDYFRYRGPNPSEELP